jgi:hypothetical protein
MLGMGFLSSLGNDCVGEQGPEVIVLTLGWCGAGCFSLEACPCACVDVSLGMYLAYLPREDGDTGLVEF